MGRLGHERTLIVRRPQAQGIIELPQLSRRTALVVPVRRSLGDATGGRASLFGIYLGQAGNPDDHAGRRRSHQDRPSRFLPPRTSRLAVARCGGMDSGDGIGWISCLVEQGTMWADSIFKQPKTVLLQAVIASTSEAIWTPSFRDGASAPDPESRDSGFDASHRPGMTGSYFQMRLRDLAARSARAVHNPFAQENRGRGECRVPAAPAVSCAKC